MHYACLLPSPPPPRFFTKPGRNGREPNRSSLPLRDHTCAPVQFTDNRRTAKKATYCQASKGLSGKHRTVPQASQGLSPRQAKDRPPGKFIFTTETCYFKESQISIKIEQNDVNYLCYGGKVDRMVLADISASLCSKPF